MLPLDRTGRAALVLAGVAAGIAVAALPAAAHVTVDPPEAVPGGYARIAFRVPNESDTADTTRIEVTFPAEAPVPSVSVQPVPGWTVSVQRVALPQPVEVEGGIITEAVSKITWTAQPVAAIKPGQFQEFPVSLGPLPAVDVLVFRTLQTYSDGTVVRWIEPPPANGAEVPDPAPVLRLRAAPAPAPAAAPDEDDGDGLTLALAVAALVAGLAGLALGGLAFARGRRPTP